MAERRIALITGADQGVGRQVALDPAAAGRTVLAGARDPARRAAAAAQIGAVDGPVHPASKAAENAMALAMMIELGSTGIEVDLVSPAFTSTAPW